MPHICHISPVHDLVDNRIFHKQCHSLRDAGFDVSWVVQHSSDEEVEGIRVIALHSYRSRWARWLLAGWEAFTKARQTKADIFHFHDPEFIPFGILLRWLGHKVVYDIHEDYVSSVSQKYYIPAPARFAISRLAGTAEQWLSGGFERVIAERYYEERFPKATKILNYPRLQERLTPCRRSTKRLLYTGKVHIYRGAEIHAAIPRDVDGVHVSFIGKCAPDLHARLKQSHGAHWDKLEFTGVGENVPFDYITQQYREGEWLAGLAIFPPNEHLEKKELTKFFEYMQYGLPIIASNFPTWRRLVEENGCGICVDPNNPQDIVDAVTRLRGDEALWQEMSANGMRTVREQFAWNSQEQALLDLYARMLR